MPDTTHAPRAPTLQVEQPQEARFNLEERMFLRPFLAAYQKLNSKQRKFMYLNDVKPQWEAKFGYTGDKKKLKEQWVREWFANNARHASVRFTGTFRRRAERFFARDMYNEEWKQFRDGRRADTDIPNDPKAQVGAQQVWLREFLDSLDVSKRAAVKKAYECQEDFCYPREVQARQVILFPGSSRFLTGPISNWKRLGLRHLDNTARDLYQRFGALSFSFLFAEQPDGTPLVVLHDKIREITPFKVETFKDRNPDLMDRLSQAVLDYGAYLKEQQNQAPIDFSTDQVPVNKIPQGRGSKPEIILQTSADGFPLMPDVFPKNNAATMKDFTRAYINAQYTRALPESARFGAKTPYKLITPDVHQFIPSECLPAGFRFREPSDLGGAEAKQFCDHILARQKTCAKAEDVFRFIKVRTGKSGTNVSVAAYEPCRSRSGSEAASRPSLIVHGPSKIVDRVEAHNAGVTVSQPPPSADLFNPGGMDINFGEQVFGNGMSGGAGLMPPTDHLFTGPNFMSFPESQMFPFSPAQPDLSPYSAPPFTTPDIPYQQTMNSTFTALEGPPLGHPFPRYTPEITEPGGNSAGGNTDLFPSGAVPVIPSPLPLPTKASGKPDGAVENAAASRAGAAPGDAFPRSSPPQASPQPVTGAAQQGKKATKKAPAAQKVPPAKKRTSKKNPASLPPDSEPAPKRLTRATAPKPPVQAKPVSQREYKDPNHPGYIYFEEEVDEEDDEDN